MTSDVVNEHRAKSREAMTAIGIDEAFISRLVDTFYERIRADAELGPVFEASLAGRWDQHLPKMKAFWSSVTLKTGSYSGRPVPAHMGVADISPELFKAWLRLFGRTLDDIAPTPEAANVFKEAAARIARSLEMALFWQAAQHAPDRRADHA